MLSLQLVYQVLSLSHTPYTHAYVERDSKLRIYKYSATLDCILISLEKMNYLYTRVTSPS